MLIKNIAAALFCCLLTCNGFSQQAKISSSETVSNKNVSHWPQWRGPAATGFSENATPPSTWSETENVAWKIEIEGEGSSTPIIWGNKIFLLSAVITDRKPETAPKTDASARTIPPKNIVQFIVWCVDRNSGKTLWKKVVTEVAPHEGRHKSTTYAASSPVTDGKHVYALFGSHGVFCLTMAGEIVWSKDLGDMRTRKGWGEAVSPSLHEDKLIVMWDQEDDSSIYALNTKDGSVAWQKDRDEPTTWATPLIYSKDGKTQVITCGTNKIRSYDINSGELAWQSGGLTLNAIPCPLIHDDHVICMSGYQGNKAVSIDLTSINSAGDPKPDWEINSGTPYVPSPLLIGKRLYFTKGLSAILSCVDVETGKPFYETQRLGSIRNLYASPVATKDHIYIAGRGGTTLVLKNAEKFEEVVANKLDGAIDASPVPVGDQLFIRSKTHLYCISENKPNETEEKKLSIKPGINQNFLDPGLNVDKFVGRFEIESREVFSARLEVLRECNVETGMSVADIGAGTGLYTRIFARTVGAKGRVYAVDISSQFLKHIRKQIDGLNMQHVTPVLCGEDNVSLPANSVDLVFVCDTYHHFEFPSSTMASIHSAMKPDARLIIVDYERIPGVTREWLLGHVRAGKPVVQKEIEAGGFEFVREVKIPGFKENYFLEFKKSVQNQNGKKPSQPTSKN